MGERRRIEPGTAVGRYVVEALLGAGGMGEVYRARDPRLGRVIALKFLGENRDRERLSRFEQEARAASALVHPSIVQVYDIGDHEGAPYIAMELVEGRTLREALAGVRCPFPRPCARCARWRGRAHARTTPASSTAT